MSRPKIKVVSLLNKSKDSALLAVEVYNKPRASFRSHGFIVLMHIAWTALFHAIFEKSGLRYFYKRNDHRYKTIAGEKIAWDLSRCIKEYFKDQMSPERKNLEFFVKLRDKIEHRFIPELDHDIFGECQAMLINYEVLLAKEFGENESINENLVFSLQFSKMLHPIQQDIKKKQSVEYRSVKEFVNEFRGRLNRGVLESMNYNFRVYLLPKVANHKSSSDFVLEYVKYDPSNPSDVEKYGKLIMAVKEKQVPIKGFKAGDVAKKVYEALKSKMSPGWKFNGSSHHVRCWKYYKVRPLRGDSNPEKTNTRYCFYDPTFGQYGFTQEWINFLINKLTEKKEFEKVMKTR